MKTSRGILSALAFTLAVGAAFANKPSNNVNQLQVVAGYLRFGSTCDYVKDCSDIVGPLCRNLSGIQLFGLNGSGTMCNITVYEQ